jgi:hypothetical protein
MFESRPPPCRPPFPPPWPPPHAAIRGAPHRRAPPFLSSSSAHALPLLLLAPCRRRPPHLGPPSATSSTHPLPDRHLLELQPTPVHLCDPSNSGRDHPSGPSPPLLPARRILPQIASSVSPQPPQLLQSDSFCPDIAPRPLSHRSRTSGSPELPGAAASSHDLPPIFMSMGRKVRWA